MRGQTPGDSSSIANPSSDPNSPFYIHPTDYPQQINVNEILSDNNYVDWSREMNEFLLAKNKLGFVDGSITKLTQDSLELKVWERYDALIRGWMTAAMQKDIRNNVKFANTYQEVWEDLEERLGKESASHAYELKWALMILRQDNAFVSTYFTKLRAIWDEMQIVLPIPRCTCGKCTCDLGK